MDVCAVGTGVMPGVLAFSPYTVISAATHVIASEARMLTVACTTLAPPACAARLDGTQNPAKHAKLALQPCVVSQRDPRVPVKALLATQTELTQVVPVAQAGEHTFWAPVAGVHTPLTQVSVPLQGLSAAQVAGTTASATHTPATQLLPTPQPVAGQVLELATQTFAMQVVPAAHPAAGHAVGVATQAPATQVWPVAHGVGQVAVSVTQTPAMQVLPAPQPAAGQVGASVTHTPATQLMPVPQPAAGQVPASVTQTPATQLLPAPQPSVGQVPTSTMQTPATQLRPVGQSAVTLHCKPVVSSVHTLPRQVLPAGQAGEHWLPTLSLMQIPSAQVWPVGQAGLHTLVLLSAAVMVMHAPGAPAAVFVSLIGVHHCVGLHPVPGDARSVTVHDRTVADSHVPDSGLQKYSLMH